ncbi:MAG: YdcF family protein [Bacteroidota bacterium]
MHLIASTILSIISSPVNWIIILVITSFIWKSPKRKKICRIAALCIYIVFGNVWLLNWYANWWQPQKKAIPQNTSYSCGILLGGFGSPDPRDSGYFNSTGDRFIQTVKLYKLGKIDHVLISGGNGRITNEKFSEGAFVNNELKIMGIPDSAIIFEDLSANTAENAVNSRALLDSAKLKPPYLLITSAHHLPRATLLFKKAGLATEGYPCAYIAGQEKFSWWRIIPSIDALNTWDNYLKELAAYLLYKIKG